MLIGFGGQLFPAHGTRKAHTLAADTFANPAGGPLGWVHGGDVGVVTAPRRGPALSLDAFEPAGVRVDVVACYPDADATALRALRRRRRARHRARGDRGGQREPGDLRRRRGARPPPGSSSSPRRGWPPDRSPPSTGTAGRRPPGRRRRPERTAPPLRRACCWPRCWASTATRAVRRTFGGTDGLTRRLRCAGPGVRRPLSHLGDTIHSTLRRPRAREDHQSGRDDDRRGDHGDGEHSRSADLPPGRRRGVLRAPTGRRSTCPAARPGPSARASSVGRCRRLP